MKIRYWFISCLAWVMALSLAACPQQQEVTDYPTPTRIPLYAQNGADVTLQPELEQRTTPVPRQTPLAEPPRVEEAPPIVEPPVATGLVEASTLRDHGVKNVEKRGQNTVDHIVVDLPSGQLLFTTIRYGGLLSLGDKRVPVPPEALHWDAHERDLVLTLPPGALANLTEYDDRWPNLSRSNWQQEVQANWQRIDPNLILPPITAALKVSTLTGERVVGADGTDLAHISDLLIDLDTNRIEYLILAVNGGFLGMGAELRAVPIGLFDLHTRGQDERDALLMLNVRESTLHAAPSYDAGRLQNGDATWEAENRRYWQNLPRHQQTAQD